MAKFIIGIDGGGTKTQGILSDLSGDVKITARAGPCNHLSEGIEAARQSLSRVINELLDQAGLQPQEVAACCAGLAGVSRENDENVMRGVLERLLSTATIRVEIDAMVALAGALECRPGVILISGTGSIAFGVNSQGQRVRAGGWGHIFGDEGSGFDIARRGLIAALHEYDGRGPKTLIRQKICDQMMLGSTEEIISMLYTNPLSPHKIARLYPVVVEAADEGDDVALSLIRGAAQALADAAEAVIVKLEMPDSRVELATAGGVFRGRFLRQSFREILSARRPEVLFVKAAHPPEVGALMLAQAVVANRKVYGE